MTVRDLLLDSNGDLELVGGGALASDEAAIGQEISLRLHTFSGEYFLDSTRGLPWMAWHHRKWSAAVIQEARILIRSELLEVPGVASVEDPGVTITRAGTQLTISAVVRTDTGELLPVEETV